jgi:hypothetical protein
LHPVPISQRNQSIAGAFVPISDPTSSDLGSIRSDIGAARAGIDTIEAGIDTISVDID